jgi:hypothetical protein
MTDSGAVFKEALVAVRRALKLRGFAAKGSTFYKKVDGGNTLVVSVQKATKSSRAETEMTINFGVYNSRIGTKLQDDSSAALDVWRAHWRERVMENGREKWLRVSAGDSAEVVARTMLDALERVLPELHARSTDESLRDEWLSRSSPGITNRQRLILLSILINEIGPADKLAGVVEELRNLVAGTVHEGLVERELAAAGVRC